MTKIRNTYTEIDDFPKDWDLVKFEDAFIKEKIKITKIKASEFKKNGKYPIVDQSINFVSGYTDDYSKLYMGDLPVIIFGDHTLVMKYVDFKFAIGADGTKILVPNNKREFYPKFLYYVLLNENIRKEGYKRHYSKLKSVKFQRPPFQAQQKIAEILSTADNAIQKVDEQISLTERLKKDMMQKLLTRGIGHTRFKMTEIGEIPEEWNFRKLEEVSILRKEQVVPRNFAGEIYLGLEHLAPSEPKITSYGNPIDVTSSKWKFYSGDILYGKLRPYLDKAVIVDRDGICSTDIHVIVPKEVEPNFLLYLLHTKRLIDYATSASVGTNHPRISWEILKDFEIPLPPNEEQIRISDILTTIDVKIIFLKDKKTFFETLKKGLMNELLTGKVRVNF